MKKTDQEKKKKTLYLFLSLFILVLSITGATYAYFALTASNNNTITGTVGGASLKLTVTKQTPSKNTNMIPQLESTLGEAISDKYGCVDDNENVVCQVYKATLTNTGSMTAELTGTISFQNISTLPNLKWALIQDEKTLGTYTSYPVTTAEAIFETKQKFAPTDSKDYYFVIWIDEIGEVQTDYGTFSASVNFTPSLENGASGISSTIVPLKLSEVTPGSYVKYAGNNGCTGKSCEGQNVNYVSDTDKGYCFSSDYKFNTTGWRVGYIKDGSAYLVSAGALNCMCTEANGTSSSSDCGTTQLSSSDFYKHINNLNGLALNYCNQNYVYGGVCDTSTVWAINNNDFQNMTGKSLNDCRGKIEDTTCGYLNDLIDNGGYYYFAMQLPLGEAGYAWRANDRGIGTFYSFRMVGVRPVIRLRSSVIVTGGTGTYEDPYRIE